MMKRLLASYAILFATLAVAPAAWGQATPVRPNASSLLGGGSLEEDSLALVALYNATNGPEWLNNTNWLSGSVETWNGVVVQDGRVVELNLLQNQLSGPIPAELGQLSNLTSLNLGINQLSGPIPAELGQLSNLVILDFFDNQLSGEISTELGQLSSVTRLRLDNNQLSGPIPLSFLDIPPFETFYFNNTDVCEPEDPDVQQWLSKIADLQSTGVVCSGNMPPLAVDDNAATTVGASVFVDVLANDSDPDGDLLTIALVGTPMNGTAEALQGQITYTPGSGFIGTDSFTYTVSDGTETDEALVTVIVSSALDVLTLTSPNPEALGNFGVSSAGVPDLNGDGRGDVLVGAWRENGGAENAGRAYVISGATGARLRTLVSPNPELDAQFGRSVAGVPDTDGDGQGDLLVGAPLEDGGASNSGRAYLFSGATGALLRTLTSPNPQLGGVFGLSVGGVMDVDGDGRGDLLVGAQGEDGGMEDAGRAYVFSGATGALLQMLESPTPEVNGFFGVAVAAVPDLDDDGAGDLLISAGGEDGGTQDAGRAYVFSGATGELLHTLASPNPEGGGQFGSAVAGVADADGDGRGDLLVGALFETVGQLDAGRAYLFSGATGDLLRTLESPSLEDNGLFGISVAGVGDADGDGRGDLLVGVRNEDGVERDAGRAYLFSGATGVVLRTLESLNPTVTGNFGISVSGVPDADGDGRGDFVVGAHREDGGDVGAGRAYLFLTGEETGNMPPLALDDAATTMEGTAVLVDVLANDSDPDGDLLTIALVGTPMNGTAEALQGQVSYAPALGFIGTDSFTYTVSDGNGGTDEALVTVSVLEADANVLTLESLNPELGGQFGVTVSGVPDADGDGKADVLVGAWQEDFELQSGGRAYLFSGATGALLHTLLSPLPELNGFFGRSVAGVDDADGDGRGDLLVSAPLEDGGAQDAGRVYLFSGATGELLRTLASPTPELDGRFGDWVAAVPDANGDGRGDLLIGASNEDGGAVNAGRAYLFSGATGALLQTIASPIAEANGAFGMVVSGVADADGDGRGDLLVGAQGEDGGTMDAGRTYLFSGATGGLLHTLVSPTPGLGGLFGRSVAGVPDADGDGRGDLLVGEDSDAALQNAGRAYLFSGATGALLQTIASPNPETGGFFGFSVAGVPDADGDGRGDLLVGAPSEDDELDNAGRAHLFSGSTGSLLLTFVSPNSELSGLFGRSVAGVDDADGDGRGDLLVSAPFEDGGAQDAGRAYVFLSDIGDLPPVAADDAATTVEGFATFADVLANDTDPNGDDLLVENVGTAMNGTVLLAGDGIRYTPDPGFTGTDSFTYTVGDGVGGTDEGTVTVTVAAIPENVRPFASPDPQSDDSFGIGVASVPDVDGDGITDLAVGAADENGIETQGRVYLYSGATGVLLRTMQSPAPQQLGSGFGISVAGVSDLNGDGAGDLLVGAYLEEVGEVSRAGRAYVFSGATGALVHTLESPILESVGLGWSVAAVPDTDGDGAEDLLVGSSGGQAHLFSGSTGLILQSFEPVVSGSLFGFSVSGLSDIDGDGRGDVVVGDGFGGAKEEGAVYVYSGATGEVLRTLQSPNPEQNPTFFGFPVAGIADVSGDGLEDILVGAFFEDGGAMSAGRAYVFDGATGDVLRTLTSPNPEESGGFGIGLASVPDADGDGQEDILVGAWNETGLSARGGRAHLFSGATGLLLRTLESPVDETGGVFGRTVAGVPDLDGDGLGDLLVGARGEEGGAKNAGRAYLILSGDGEMEAVVTVDIPAVASAGDALNLSVTVEGFLATSAELRFRPTGAPTFDALPLEMQVDSYAGAIPSEVVTLRGIEYFIVLTDGETTVTFPELDPELNPLHLRVRVAQEVSDVVLPSDAEYRMVSVPLVLDDPSPLAVFGDDYGDYGPTSWRLLRHLPLGMAYSEFPTLNSAVVPGAGFWLAAYAAADGPFDVENGLSVDASEPALLTLEPGWSQVGNPFAFPVAWDTVLGSDLVQPPAAFDGTEYLLDQPLLDPWAGYFVLNDTEETVTLTVPPLEGGLPTRLEAKGKEDGYRLHLRADVPARGLRDTQNVLGFAEGAAAGPDRLDLAEPPPIASHLRLSAVEDGRRLGHSFRPAGTDGADWELELTATADVLADGPLSVRVALEEAGERPDGYYVHVLDLDAEAPLTLLEGAFEVTLSAARPVQRLRLIAGTEAFADAARGDIPLVPITFALAPAYPNPFAGSATLAYDLPEPADVVLDVFDLLGRRVAVLADGVQEAGRYTVRWDGTVAGAPAANGVYVYRLRAGSFTASHKMVLLR
ncbi:MAG: Ig-like domain-containing protein [Rhodothermales bacterium]